MSAKFKISNFPIPLPVKELNRVEKIHNVQLFKVDAVCRAPMSTLL